MEMQCELLTSNFSNPKTIALVKENIGHGSDGSSPHCAGALKLGLKQAFELKKKKRQPPGVKLRCTHRCCTWYTNDISYSSIESGLYCQRSYGHSLQCVGCGYKRTGSYASCQNCGKKII